MVEGTRGVDGLADANLGEESARFSQRNGRGKRPQIRPRSIPIEGRADPADVSIDSPQSGLGEGKVSDRRGEPHSCDSGGPAGTGLPLGIHWRRLGQRGQEVSHGHAPRNERVRAGIGSQIGTPIPLGIVARRDRLNLDGLRGGRINACTGQPTRGQQGGEGGIGGVTQTGPGIQQADLGRAATAIPSHEEIQAPISIGIQAHHSHPAPARQRSGGTQAYSKTETVIGDSFRLGPFVGDVQRSVTSVSHQVSPTDRPRRIGHRIVRTIRATQHGRPTRPALQRGASGPRHRGRHSQQGDGEKAARAGSFGIAATGSAPGSPFGGARAVRAYLSRFTGRDSPRYSIRCEMTKKVSH